MKSNQEFSRPLSKALLLRFVRLLRPELRTYALVCAFGLMVAALEMIPPRLVGRTIDLITSGGSPIRSVLWLAAAWLVVASVTQVVHGFQIARANQAGERVLSSIRFRLFSHLQHLSMSYFDKTHAGRIIARASSDIDSLRSVLIWGLNTIVANSAVMLLSATMILLTDSRLFFAVVWLAPAMTAVTFIYGSRVGRAWQTVRSHSTAVSANQAENIAGVRVVVAFNRQQENLRRYSELQHTNTRFNVWASRMAGTFQPMLQWTRFIGQGIILLYGGYRVSLGTLRAGDLAAVSLYWEWFMQPAVNFGVFFNELLIALSGAERVFDLLDEAPEVSDVPGAKELPELRGHVRFENVHFHYRPGRPILHGIDFEVPGGSTVALVGSTGSGKSTIISLLSRFYQPQYGRILIDDFDIAHSTDASLHRQQAMVLQSNFLFAGSVLDNIRYARPTATYDDVVLAAKDLGCHERFLALKQGYDTDVGERGAALSLGERQLVCLTRAMLADPRILLLDEATSAIDLMTELQIQHALNRLARNRTTFIVAHRLSTIMNADHILVLDHGKIIERGTHDELLGQGGKYAQLCAHSETTAETPAL